jgi:imidazole glycerol phosphate synthase, glutamine amidotransferase subunit
MANPEIAVIDYGMGNLRSVVNALKYCGADAQVVDCADKISEYDGAILPGVGSFGPASNFLQSGLFDRAIHEYVNSGKMILGICLGFQLLFSKGFENGEYQGLGLIKGEVKKFEFSDNKLKIPHMGWNNAEIADTPYAKLMFNGITNKEYFYFVHSYYCSSEDKSKASSFCDYGINFCSSVAHENIWGCQFHPERSGVSGLKLLSNFINEIKKR